MKVIPVKIVKSTSMNARVHHVSTMANVYKDLIRHFIHCQIGVRCRQYSRENFHIKTLADMNVVRFQSFLLLNYAYSMQIFG